jgi:FkbM family methyltransferase
MPPDTLRSPRQVLLAVRLKVIRVLLRVLTRVERRADLIRLGSRECGWVVPSTFLSPGGVFYCAGAGEDISFDLELARIPGSQVVTIDPTPRAVRYVAEQIADRPNMRLLPLGLWARNETLRFFAPRDVRHVSHSIVNLQRTDSFFEAECRTVTSIMRTLGHSRIRILKLDIEGAQFEVLENVLDEGVSVDIICAEFDQPSPVARTLRMVSVLRRAGYHVVNIEGLNFTFVRSGARP